MEASFRTQALWRPARERDEALRQAYQADMLSGDRISHFNMVRTSVSTSCQWISASPCSAEADARHMDHVHPWYVYPIPTLLPKTG